MTSDDAKPDAIGGGEVTIPILPCISADETLAFYRALGFRVTYEMTRPYLYLAVRFSGFELHFGKAPKGLDPSHESSGTCLVMVDAVEPYHRAFTAGLRAAYGKVLAKGRPRITRFRPGQTRFSLIDPSGNSIIFVQKDEPDELAYGGSRALSGLAKAIDNARILREFKNDDAAAARALDSALRKHGAAAPAVERARALAARMELAVALDDSASARRCRDELRALPLTDEERAGLAGELAAADRLEQWLSATATAPR